MAKGCVEDNLDDKSFNKNYDNIKIKLGINREWCLYFNSMDSGINIPHTSVDK